MLKDRIPGVLLCAAAAEALVEVAKWPLRFLVTEAVSKPPPTDVT